MPLDTNIPWVQNDVEKITWSPKGNTPDWHECLQKAASIPKLTLPLTVNSWCIHCREHTVLSGKRSIFIDSEPQWTLGFVRPLYLERRPICLRCQEFGQPEARFVPPDENIPSITRWNLSSFAKSFGKFDHHMKSKLLDHWPVSSKMPRHPRMYNDSSSGCTL